MPQDKYKTHIEPQLAAIEGWARNGLSLEQIAHNLGVHKASVCRYMKVHSDLCDAIKKGREVSDYEVENAMHKEATGYYYTEEAVTNKGDVVKIQKYSRPNVTAQIFWLKNRKASEWRDKQEVKHDIDVSLADVLTEAWKIEE